MNQSMYVLLYIYRNIAEKKAAKPSFQTLTQLLTKAIAAETVQQSQVNKIFPEAMVQRRRLHVRKGDGRGRRTQMKVILHNLQPSSCPDQYCL